MYEQKCVKLGPKSDVYIVNFVIVRILLFRAESKVFEPIFNQVRARVLKAGKFVLEASCTALQYRSLIVHLRPTRALEAAAHFHRAGKSDLYR